MTIGDFSRAVRMTAKALRFYHRNGLLAPAVVDDRNGYRLYAPDQIADAQIVRTLRGLDVPVDAIRQVLSARDVDARAELLSGHLAQMERKLDETQKAVGSLRAMLERPATAVAITHRSVSGMRVAAVRETLRLDELGEWFRRSVETLTAVAARADPEATGSIGGLWPNELFTEGRGTATVFLPLRPAFDERAAGSDATVLELPPVELAVAVHDGSDETIPQVYAALGEHVARHELSVDAPVRETYLTGFPGIDARAVTEIGWPVFRVSH